MKKQLFILLLPVIFILAGCFQMSSLQTARTLPKGDTVLGAAIAGQGFVFEGSPAAIPQLEIYGRRGIAQNFDLGIKLSSAASIGFDGKYQFEGNQTSKTANAVGGGVEFRYDFYQYITSYQTLAMYFSAHPNESLASVWNAQNYSCIGVWHR